MSFVRAEVIHLFLESSYNMSGWMPRQRKFIRTCSSFWGFHCTALALKKGDKIFDNTQLAVVMVVNHNRTLLFANYKQLTHISL